MIKILAIHYLADFIFQSRWMGENKSKNIYALILHIIVYSITLSVVTNFTYGLLNGLIHFFVDFITSRLSSFAYKEGNMQLFWAIIGLDQLIHNLTLIVTLPILLA